MSSMSLPTIRMTASTVVMFVQALQQHRLALFGGVLLDDPVELGIDMRQRGDDQRGQGGHVGAVQSAEGVAEIADGRSENRADDVEFGRIGAAHLGGPRARQTAAGVAPQADRRRRRQAEPLGVQGGPQPVEDW